MHDILVLCTAARRFLVLVRIVQVLRNRCVVGAADQSLRIAVILAHISFFFASGFVDFLLREKNDSHGLGSRHLHRRRMFLALVRIVQVLRNIFSAV